MGADMLIEVLVIDEKKKPNWDKGRAKIEELKKTLPVEVDEDEVDEGFFDNLGNDLDELIQAYDGDHREAAALWVGGKKILITGGLSWGDPPTELYRIFSRLIETGVAEACGFTDQKEEPKGPRRPMGLGGPRRI